MSSRSMWLFCVLIGGAGGLLAALAPGMVAILLTISVLVGLLAWVLPPEDRTFCLCLIGWGMLARVVLGAALNAVSLWRGGGGWFFGDSLGVHNYAWLLIQHLQGAPTPVYETMTGDLRPIVFPFLPMSHPYGYHGMTYLVAAWYDLFGPIKFSMRLLNMFCGALAGVGVYAIAKPIFGRRAAQGSALMSVFLPSLMLWSVTLMKDSLYILAEVGFVWALVRLQRRRAPRDAVTALLALALQDAIRPTFPHLAIAGICGIGVALSWFRFPQRRFRMFLMATCALAILSYPMIRHRGHQAMALAVAYSRGVYGTGGSVYQVFDAKYYPPPGQEASEAWPGQITAWDFSKGFARGWWYFLTVPWPSHLTTAQHVAQQLVSAPQMALWYLVLLWVPAGLRHGWKADRAASLCLGGYLFLITSIVAVTSGNIGTAFRHRDMVTPFYLMLGIGGLLSCIERKAEHDAAPT